MTTPTLQSLLPHEVDTISIALDMESVLANCHGYFLDVYNDRHGTEYVRDDIDAWDWVREEVELDEFNEIIDSGWVDHPDMITPMEPRLEAVIQELSTHPRVDLDIVTARTGVEDAMQEWLVSHDITAYDTFVSTDRSKAELRYDVYIDDKPLLADNLATGQMQFLIAGPHNTTAKTHDRTITVPTVREASETLFEFLAERGEQ